MLGAPDKGRATAHVTPRPRSVPHEPARLARRSPDRGETPVQRSKRTSPQGRASPSEAAPPPRGPRIRSTGNGLLTRGRPTDTPAGASALSQTDPTPAPTAADPGAGSSDDAPFARL